MKTLHYQKFPLIVAAVLALMAFAGCSSTGRPFDHQRFQRELVVASQDLDDLAAALVVSRPELAERAESLSEVALSASVKVQQAIDSGTIDQREIALALIGDLLLESDAILEAIGVDPEDEDLRLYVVAAKIMLRRARERL